MSDEILSHISVQAIAELAGQPIPAEMKLRCGFSLPGQRGLVRRTGSSRSIHEKDDLYFTVIARYDVYRELLRIRESKVSFGEIAYEHMPFDFLGLQTVATYLKKAPDGVTGTYSGEVQVQACKACWKDVTELAEIARDRTLEQRIPKEKTKDKKPTHVEQLKQWLKATGPQRVKEVNAFMWSLAHPGEIDELETWMTRHSRTYTGPRGSTTELKIVRNSHGFWGTHIGQLTHWNVLARDGEGRVILGRNDSVKPFSEASRHKSKQLREQAISNVAHTFEPRSTPT